MNVKVKNTDGTVITYGYAPEHKAHVIDYYTNAYYSNRIDGFTATHDNGEVISIGAI